MPTRRALLAAAGTGLTAGCAYEMPTATPASSPTATDEPTPTEPPVCDEVEVVDLDFRAATPESPTDDGTDEEYVVVVVESTTAEPPALVGRIVACDGEMTVRRELDGEGTHTVEFGPYETGCVSSVEFGFEGCNR